MKIFTLLLLSLCLFSCNNLKTDEKINAAQVNSTIKKSKIKRVLDDDIVAFAYEKGQEATTKIEAALPANNTNPCNTNLIPLLDSLKSVGVSNINIRCEPRLFTHPKEKEMWEAYQQAFEQEIEAPAGVQRLGAKQSYQQLLYAKPIFYQENDQRKWAMLSILMDKKDLIMLY